MATMMMPELDLPSARAEVRVSRLALLEALMKVVGVVPTKAASLPAVQSLLVETDPAAATLTLTATDLDRWVTTTTNAESTERIALLLPAKRLYDVVRALPAGQLVTIRANDRQVLITAGRARAQLLGLEAHEFPERPTPVGGAITGLTAGALAAALKQVAYAVSSEESRPILNSICLDGRKDSLVVVAIDGHQCARVPLESTVPAGLIDREVLLPPAMAITLATSFPPETALALYLEAQRLTLVGGGTTATTRLIEGPYPPYRQVIPQDAPRTLLVERAALLEVVRRALTLADADANRLTLSLVSETECQVAARAPDAGAVQDVVAVTHTWTKGDVGFRIGFNGRYLVNALSMLESDQVRIDLWTPESPAIFTDPADVARATLALVMPLRVVD